MERMTAEGLKPNISIHKELPSHVQVSVVVYVHAHMRSARP